MSGCHPTDFEQDKIRMVVAPSLATIEWTICGFCLERVKVNEQHGCDLIKSIKEKFNSALSAIQHDTDNRFKIVHEKVNELWQHAGMGLEDLKAQIIHERHRTDALKKSLDSVISNVKGIDYLIKQMGLCVDNSHVESTAKMLKKRGIELPRIGELNKMVQEEINNQPTDDNKEIKRLRSIINSLSDERWELQKRLDTLIECLDLKQGEVNRLTERMEELVKKFNADNGGFY